MRCGAIHFVHKAQYGTVRMYVLQRALVQVAVCPLPLSTAAVDCRCRGKSVLFSWVGEWSRWLLGKVLRYLQDHGLRSVSLSLPPPPPSLSLSLSLSLSVSLAPPASEPPVPVLVRM